jgi:hypothetical protein
VLTVSIAVRESRHSDVLFVGDASTLHRKRAKTPYKANIDQAGLLPIETAPAIDSSQACCL